MNERIKVAMLIGSLRKDSLNRQVAARFVHHAQDRLDIREVQIDDLPHYNEDLETTAVPASWTRFRDAVRDVDAIAIFTPEYNRSLPSALKNALDVGSRPYGHSVWNGKPAIVVSGSIGATGGMAANHAVRQAVIFLNMPVMQQPEAYLGGLRDKIDADGTIKDASLDSFIATVTDAAVDWYRRLSG